MGDNEAEFQDRRITAQKRFLLYGPVSRGTGSIWGRPYLDPLTSLVMSPLGEMGDRDLRVIVLVVHWRLR